MRNIFILLFSISSASMANASSILVSDLIPQELSRACCPGPACVADSFLDHSLALFLKNEIETGRVNLDLLKSCDDLEKALNINH